MAWLSSLKCPGSRDLGEVVQSVPCLGVKVEELTEHFRVLQHEQRVAERPFAGAGQVKGDKDPRKDILGSTKKYVSFSPLFGARMTANSQAVDGSVQSLAMSHAALR